MPLETNVTSGFLNLPETARIRLLTSQCKISKVNFKNIIQIRTHIMLKQACNWEFMKKIMCSTIEALVEKLSTSN